MLKWSLCGQFFYAVIKTYEAGFHSCQLSHSVMGDWQKTGTLVGGDRGQCRDGYELRGHWNTNPSIAISAHSPSSSYDLESSTVDATLIVISHYFY